MLQNGNRTKLYGGFESSFGVPPTILASHALRHITAQFDYNPYNRIFSPEKKAGPGRYARFDRPSTAGFTIEGLLRPSGTLNTLPECSFALEAGLGQKTNVALSTTVNVTTAVGGATLADVTGLVAKTGGLNITCPDGKIRQRLITSVNGGTKAVTWWPDLPSGQAPANGAAVKSCTAYSLTAASAASIFLARYLFQADLTAGLSEIIKGGIVDKFSLMFDARDEPRFNIGGPAKLKADAPSIPGGFTQVGTNPYNGMNSEAVIAGLNFATGYTAFPYLKIAIEGATGRKLRMDESNTSSASEAYQGPDARDLQIGLDMYAENGYKSALYDLCMAGTDMGLFQQTGFVQGKCTSLVLPRVEIPPPTMDVGSDVKWPFKGLLAETVEDTNDELIVLVG